MPSASPIIAISEQETKQHTRPIPTGTFYLVKSAWQNRYLESVCGNSSIPGSSIGAPGVLSTELLARRGGASHSAHSRRIMGLGYNASACRNVRKHQSSINRKTKRTDDLPKPWSGKKVPSVCLDSQDTVEAYGFHGHERKANYSQEFLTKPKRIRL
jgi:hypothetical protein